MTIKVVCQCGATFGAKDELAGRTVACPKCKQPLRIGAAPAPAPAPARAPTPAPAAGGMSDLLDEAGIESVQGPRCPQCSKQVQHGALLCTNCGFNLQTGESIEGAEIAVQGEGGDMAVADMLLSSAADRIANEKLEDKKTRAQGAPIWVYCIALAGVLAFVACMLMIPREIAFVYNGWGLIIFGNVIVVVYSIRIIIVAFQEDITCGLLYLFLPFYSLYYFVTRWDRVKGFIIMWMVGNMFASIGGGMIAMAPMMKIKARDDAHLYQHTPPSRVAVADPAEHRPAASASQEKGLASAWSGQLAQPSLLGERTDPPTTGIGV